MIENVNKKSKNQDMWSEMIHTKVLGTLEVMQTFCCLLDSHLL